MQGYVKPIIRDFNPDRIILHARTNDRQKQPPEVFYEKDVLKDVAKFTEKKPMPVSFLITLQALAYTIIKKETVAQVFSCELCEIFMNTFFTEHLRWLLLDVNSEKTSSQIAKPIIDLTRSLKIATTQRSP